jgi:hypothetical protein
LPRNRKWWKRPKELHWALPFFNGIETLFTSLPEYYQFNQSEKKQLDSTRNLALAI